MRAVTIVRTRGAIARLLGVSERTVNRWVKRYHPPITREGNGVLVVRRDALLRWHARFCGNPALHDDA